MTAPQKDCRIVLIEVELPEKSRKRFEERYKQMTGETIVPGPHYQIQENKRSVEMRVYFDADPSVVQAFEKNYNVQKGKRRGYRSDFPYRIDRNHLAWSMIRAGWRIGLNDKK